VFDLNAKLKQKVGNHGKWVLFLMKKYRIDRHWLLKKGLFTLL